VFAIRPAVLNAHDYFIDPDERLRIAMARQ
jgi:hypothetical protein